MGIDDFGKIRRRTKGLFFFLKYRIGSLGKVTVSKNNSIDGKIAIKAKRPSMVKIGDNFMCRGPIYIDALDGGEIKIGKDVFLNHNCSIAAMESIKVGDGCMFGNNVVVVDHNHILGSDSKNDYERKTINIGNNVWVGANCTILPGTIIGDGSVIGANSVVNSVIGSGELWCGTPAKYKKRVMEK